LLFPPGQVRAEEAPRNIVLLIADDLGLDLGCYGNKAIRTPNLDALAQRGTRFSHGFATVSSCSPSRSVLFTGLHTHTSGQYGLAHAAHNFHTRDQVKSLPRLLKDAGYRPAILGKNHVLPPEVYPFEEVKGNYRGNRSVAEMAKRAREFMTECGTKPFLLVVGFSDPHRAGKGFANDTSYPGVKETTYDPKDVIVPYHLPDRPEVRKELAEYYQSVSRMDTGVGLLLQALRETGNENRTLVLFVSDNGIPFPGAKTNLYDAGVHLPMLAASPAQQKHGVENHALASFVDITPTILDWARVKAPANLTGRSLLPILEQTDPKGWDAVFGSHQTHEITMYYPIRMLRTREHKYLLNLAHGLEYPHSSDLWGSETWQGILKRGDKMMGQRSVAAYLNRPREELYDLTKDPNELKNVAGDPAYQEVLKGLRQRVKEWQTKTNDPWLVKYQHE
jgi:N-sulfoglucosamine sulfohydrolase